ncbi:hypothetical protein [Rhodococcus tibetensis]|uniref:Terminase small subunit n=1 Tax=Rhodococcus tibetensis TaxID=2965064 RepID=A0ABT1QH37_9NOCA|nr:hypothetical protein [Rhodococcus sp. FXJ9.536]MCQ4120415.1 hypothetical protein [Rhodococcus sp. FXJ9.536]
MAKPGRPRTYEHMSDDDAGLFAAPKPAPPPKGRHSEAVERALAAAERRHMVEDVDEALLVAVRAGAWALDTFEAENKPYGPSKLLTPYIEALREARLTPDSRATETDDNLKGLLDALGTPTASSAPVHHPAG